VSQTSDHRSLLTLALIVLPIVDLGYMIDENTKGAGVANVHIVAAAVKIVSYAWAMILHFMCMRRGLVSFLAVLLILYFWSSVPFSWNLNSILSHLGVPPNCSVIKPRIK
jgi:hypothetical protein